jgi:hypothetical protein
MDAYEFEMLLKFNILIPDVKAETIRRITIGGCWQGSWRRLLGVQDTLTLTRRLWGQILGL